MLCGGRDREQRGEAPATGLVYFHAWCLTSLFADLAAVVINGSNDQVRMFPWCFRVPKYFSLQYFMGPSQPTRVAG